MAIALVGQGNARSNVCCVQCRPTNEAVQNRRSPAAGSATPEGTATSIPRRRRCTRAVASVTSR